MHSLSIPCWNGASKHILREDFKPRTCIIVHFKWREACKLLMSVCCILQAGYLLNSTHSLFIPHKNSSKVCSEREFQVKIRYGCPFWMERGLQAAHGCLLLAKEWILAKIYAFLICPSLKLNSKSYSDREFQAPNWYKSPFWMQTGYYTAYACLLYTRCWIHANIPHENWSLKNVLREQVSETI